MKEVVRGHLFLVGGWGLGGWNSGLGTSTAGALPLEPHQCIFLWLFWRWQLMNYSHGMASSHDSPNVSHPSWDYINWNYRCEPLVPG
jgi:hypothetical protein